MSRNQDFERKEMERRFRRRIFQTVFVSVAAMVAAVLLWKLRSLLVPILVGALLAYLFRPLRDRFQVGWLSHEMRVLTLFAVIGAAVFAGVNGLRKQLPNERQKLELKVRLKYKLNEKFREIVGSTGPGASSGGRLLAREAGPMMDQINRLLEDRKSVV